MTQDDVAAHCETTVQTVRRWEKRPIIPAEKLSLLVTLGFDIQYVVTGMRSKNLFEVRKQFSGLPQDLIVKDTEVDRVYTEAGNATELPKETTLNQDQLELLSLWKHIPIRSRSTLMVLMQQLIPHTDMGGTDDIQFLDPDRVHDMTPEEHEAHREKRRQQLKAKSPATIARKKRIKANRRNKSTHKEKEKV
ncbi:MAG: hypothetical protein AB2552_05695 [Candidatus Thiodiazotropha endolucinida]